jgi:hypothetical protein
MKSSASSFALSDERQTQIPTQRIHTIHLHLRYLTAKKHRDSRQGA